MTRTILLMTLSMALVACGKSSAPENAAAAAPAEAAAGAPASAGRDICALIEDPDTLFGQAVTATPHDGPGGINACEWKNAEGRLCGMVTPMGPGWHEVPSLAQGFSGMVTSMGAFGKTYPVAGIGEEAAAVDGGMLGAQMAIRTGTAIANIGAACGGNGAANLEHAEKIARAIAPRL
jgi:hypothetical protein